MVHRVAAGDPSAVAGGLRASRDGLRLGALILICFATTARLGNLDPLGLVLLMAAIGLMLISLVAPRATAVGAPVWSVAVAALLLMLLQYPNNFRREFDPHLFGPMAAVGVIAALGVILFRARRRTSRWLLGVLGLSQLTIMAVSMKRTWGGPPIDVFDVQQQAAQALLQGINPYTVLIDQVVGNGIGPGRLIPGHFPYGPSVVLLDIPARALGDIRLTHLAAVAVLLVVLMTLARRGAPGRELLIAVLWLAFPLSAGMVEHAWFDVVTMAGLGGWLVLRGDHRWWAIAVLGVALAAKPIFLPALIPIIVWSRHGRQEMVLAGLAATLIVLPFAIETGLGAFLTDVVGNHVSGEPRYDSLNVESYLHLTGHGAIPLAATILIVLTVTAISTSRRPRDQGDALTAGAVICTIGFLMFKQAYFNYYFIPGVLLVMALAAGQLAFDGPSPERATR